MDVSSNDALLIPSTAVESVASAVPKFFGHVSQREQRSWPHLAKPHLAKPHLARICVLSVLAKCVVCVCFVCFLACVFKIFGVCLQDFWWVSLVSVFKIFGGYLQDFWAFPLDPLPLLRLSAPSPGPPLRRTAQNFALFLSLPPEISFYLLSLGVFSLSFGGVFEGRGAQMCTFGLSGCRVKPRRNFGPPPFRAPTQQHPHSTPTDEHPHHPTKKIGQMRSRPEQHRH